MYITTEDMKKLIDVTLSRTVKHPTDDIRSDCYGYMRGCLETIQALLTEEKDEDE